MRLSLRTSARIAFWIVFLGAAGVAARQVWVKLDPLRNHPAISKWWLAHNVGKLSSKDRVKAVAAWTELERCFLTKWSAYDWVVYTVKQNIWKPDDPPIHFELRRSGDRFVANPRGQLTECRTVTEALMAMLHQEPTRRTLYSGDWRRWWDANWMYFPNRELNALPSGPEDPSTARRRR